MLSFTMGASFTSRPSDALSVAVSSAFGETGEPVASFIQMSGATFPIFAIRSNSPPRFFVFSICCSIWKAMRWPIG